MEEKKPHPLTGKRNAAKPDHLRAAVRLHIRCRQADKDLWAEAARLKGVSVSNWAINTLNRKALENINEDQE